MNCGLLHHHTLYNVSLDLRAQPLRCGQQSPGVELGNLPLETGEEREIVAGVLAEGPCANADLLSLEASVVEAHARVNRGLVGSVDDRVQLLDQILQARLGAEQEVSETVAEDRKRYDVLAASVRVQLREGLEQRVENIGAAVRVLRDAQLAVLGAIQVADADALLAPPFEGVVGVGEIALLGGVPSFVVARHRRAFKFLRRQNRVEKIFRLHAVSFCNDVEECGGIDS